MTWEDLPNHCARGNCAFCRERRARRRAQSIADSIACAKPSTTFDYWNRPIPPRKVGIEPPRGGGASTTTGRVIYLREPRPVGAPRHRKIWHGL